MTLYLDTSSLIKLYVAERGSDDVRQIVGKATVVATSLVAYVETRAALARLKRDGQLKTSEFRSARRQFEQQWPAYVIVEVTDALCQEAGDLAEKYELRGFDSIHLASFAEIARAAGIHDTRFSSVDDRLNGAARQLTRVLERARL